MPSEFTLAMKQTYAIALIAPGCDTGAAPDDVNEAETTLEEIERTARRVLGGAHPTTTEIEKALELLRLLRANEKIVGVRPKNSLDKIQTNTT